MSGSGWIGECVRVIGELSEVSECKSGGVYMSEMAYSGGCLPLVI